MPTFDASSMIYGWDNYRLAQFPALWRWMAAQIGIRAFNMPQVAFEEVMRRAPDCGRWLRESDIQRLPVSNDIVHEALRIKRLIGVEDDRFFGVGVGENDVFIIATASVEDLELISNEGRQSIPPQDLRRYKIPAVCALEDVDVPCIDFLRLITDSGEIFGE